MPGAFCFSGASLSRRIFPLVMAIQLPFNRVNMFE